MTLSSISYQGKKRVLITSVSPQIDQGNFPAKSALDEVLTLSAEIIRDGFDETSASAFVKKPMTEVWVEFPMRLLYNDHWEVDLLTEEIGLYEFRIEAWIDHYKTWQNGLKKKFDAGQDIALALKIGAGLLKDAAQKLPLASKELTQWSKIFLSAKDPKKAVDLASSPEVLACMYQVRDPDKISISQTFRIESERKKAGFSAWYELFPRSTSPDMARSGTLKDVIELLPRISKLGFDVLYLPPIHPIGVTKRKGKNNSLLAQANDVGSPWAIGHATGGHKAIHPELGSLEDLKQLVHEAKKYGIDIAIDIAFQCSPDHPYVKDHPQWFQWRPDGTVQYSENPPKKYEDILPFYFETEDWQNLWLELKSVIDYWIETGITIFRIDNPHTKSFLFWEWLIQEVRRKHPEILFLAEAFTTQAIMQRLAKAGFNQSYTYFSWRDTKYELEEYMNELTKSDMRYYFRPNFWPNTPDILPSSLIKGGERAHLMRLILAATLSSNYGVYGPVYDFGINEVHGAKDEYTDNEKYEIKHWDWNRNTPIMDLMTKINQIRKENKALQSTWNIEFAKTSNDKILAFAKYDAKSGNFLLIVVNLDIAHTQGAHIKMPFEMLGLADQKDFMITDLLSGVQYVWKEDWHYVQFGVDQLPAHIFRIDI